MNEKRDENLSNKRLPEARVSSPQAKRGREAPCEFGPLAMDAARFSASPVKSPPNKEASTIRIVDYSARSVALFGDMKPVKEKLKSMGGRYNGHLKDLSDG